MFAPWRWKIGRWTSAKTKNEALFHLTYKSPIQVYTAVPRPNGKQQYDILHQQLLLYVVEKLDVIYITVIFFDVSAACL